MNCRLKREVDETRLLIVNLHKSLARTEELLQKGGCTSDEEGLEQEQLLHQSCAGMKSYLAVVVDTLERKRPDLAKAL